MTQEGNPVVWTCAYHRGPKGWDRQWFLSGLRWSNRNEVVSYTTLARAQVGNFRVSQFVDDFSAWARARAETGVYVVPHDPNRVTDNPMRPAEIPIPGVDVSGYASAQVKPLNNAEFPVQTGEERPRSLLKVIFSPRDRAGDPLTLYWLFW
jgi:hypothetical protein